MRKLLKSGDLVYFDSYTFGLSEEPEQWVAIIVDPRNLLQNAKIRIQKSGKTYKRIPYRYLTLIEG